MPKLTSTGLILLASCVLVALPAWAELPADDLPETMDERDLDDARERLADTAALDDPADLEAAERALRDAQEDLDRAIDAGAGEAKIERLTLRRDEAQVAVDWEIQEPEAVADALAAMTDAQVAAANRSLNDTRNNGRIIDLDAATLQDIVDRELAGREIQALTKALEEEAKFEGLAARFDRKYEETGREPFRRNRDRALDRAEHKRERFERKVDRFVDRRDGIRDEVRAEARNEVRGEAKKAARANARAEARRTARIAARDEAKKAGKANGRGRN